MHQIHPNASLTTILKRMAAAGLVYRLFTNDFTPGAATVLGDFTECAADHSYVGISQDDTNFTSSGVSGGVGTISGPDVTFTVTGGTYDCYGYYVTDAGNTKLIACARFSDAPKTLTPASTISVTPKLSTSSRYTS